MKFIKKNHYIRSESRTLHAVFIEPIKLNEEVKVPTVIMFHGMTSSNKSYVEIGEKLAKHNIGSVAVSLGGHGESTGNFNDLSVNDLIDDGINSMKYLEKLEWVNMSKLGGLGTSVGAHVIANTSKYYLFKSMFLRVPATYTEIMSKMKLPEIMNSEDRIFLLTQEELETTSSIKAIMEFSGSLLVMTSERDMIIPKIIPETYLNFATNCARREAVVIKDASHNLTNSIWREQFIAKSISWFVDTLS